MQKKYTTLYQLLIDDRDVKRCRKSGKRLFDHLKSLIEEDVVRSVEIGLNSSETGPALFLCVRKIEANYPLPDSFEGFEVRYMVSGEKVT